MKMKLFMNSKYLSPLFCLFLLFFPTLSSVEAAIPGGMRFGFALSEGKRFLLEGSSSSDPQMNYDRNGSFVLAANRTYRKNPLKGFHHYTGGWNIGDRQYWASVGFTAVPVFAIAGIWFLLVGVTLFCAVCCNCCSTDERRSYHRSNAASSISFFFLTVFTMAVIIGSVVLYTGQGRFHGSTTSTLDYVVGQANLTVSNLKNLSNYLSSSKGTEVSRRFFSEDDQNKIDALHGRLDSNANDLAYQTGKNSDGIRKLLDSVGLDLKIVAAVMLSLVVLGFIFSTLGWLPLVNFLLFIGWLLVTGTLILSGVLIILNNSVSDTCVAMDEWVSHPTAKTAFDRILPCVDVATANESLYQSKKITYQMVDGLNQFITNIGNRDFRPPVQPPLYYNQSGPLMPTLCNPFTPELKPQQCKAGEVDFKNATQVWQGFICKVSPSGICTTVGRVTPENYVGMVSTVNVSYGLHYYVPFLVQLEDCTFVRETFGNITKSECPGLRRYSGWVCIGLLMVSVSVMLSLVFWVIHAGERRRLCRSGEAGPPQMLPLHVAPYRRMYQY